MSTTRYSYYGSPGTPTVKFDGNNDVSGGTTLSTGYPRYRRFFDTHKTVTSPLEIDLSTTYDSAARTGVLTIKMKNTTASAVSGQLQVALCESHMYYSWTGGMDSVHHIARNMLPSATGEAVSIPANDSLVKTRDFTIDAAWVARKCDFVVFVQNNSSKAIYQGARTGVYQDPLLSYVGYQPAFPMPGRDVDLVVGVRNTGFGAATGVSGVLSTTDPYVTVTQPNAAYADIGSGQDVYSMFTIHVDAGCPDPHLATFDLALSSSDEPLGTVSFPMNVATHTGFADSMEAGVGAWTHSGTADQWHQTTHRCGSPTHSWYSGTENTWQYTIENDARLTAPYFTVGTVTEMGFRHFYATEVDYDFGMIEINNGSPFWNTLALYNGSSGSIQDVLLPLDAYGGQTARVRFRFVSDISVNDEGWYVDDFWAGPMMAVAEDGTPGAARATLYARPNPAQSRIDIGYAAPLGNAAGLAVHDAGGRLVRNLASDLTGSGSRVWDLADDAGRPVQSGTYFVRLTGGRTATMAKLIVAR